MRALKNPLNSICALVLSSVFLSYCAVCTADSAPDAKRWTSTHLAPRSVFALSPSHAETLAARQFYEDRRGFRRFLDDESRGSALHNMAFLLYLFDKELLGKSVDNFGLTPFDLPTKVFVNAFTRTGEVGRRVFRHWFEHGCSSCPVAGDLIFVKEQLEMLGLQKGHTMVHPDYEEEEDEDNAEPSAYRITSRGHGRILSTILGMVQIVDLDHVATFFATHSFFPLVEHLSYREGKDGSHIFRALRVVDKLFGKDFAADTLVLHPDLYFKGGAGDVQSLEDLESGAWARLRNVVGHNVLQDVFKNGHLFSLIAEYQKDPQTYDRFIDWINHGNVRPGKRFTQYLKAALKTDCFYYGISLKAISHLLAVKDHPLYEDPADRDQRALRDLMAQGACHFHSIEELEKIHSWIPIEAKAWKTLMSRRPFLLAKLAWILAQFEKNHSQEVVVAVRNQAILYAVSSQNFDEWLVKMVLARSESKGISYLVSSINDTYKETFIQQVFGA